MPKTQSQTEAARASQPEFTVHFEESLRGLRGTLTELLASVDADPTAPQVISRRFRINKNLAWKVSKIVNAPDLVGVASHVPGPAGGKILLEALRRGGAPADVLARTRTAMEEFEEMVRLHAGDRASLELLLSSMLPDRVESRSLEAARKLSFQGNSATWGVQARAQVTLHMIFPSKEPEMVDGVSVQGLVDFCRLRPSATWPVARFQTWRGEPVPTQPHHRPLDPRCIEDDGVPLLREYCTGHLPEIREVPIAEGMSIELGEGPVGNTATATCMAGILTERLAPQFSQRPGSVASLRAVLNTPVEALQLDLLLHKDLGFGKPEAFLISALERVSGHEFDWDESQTLPITERVESLGSGPPVLASPLVSRYRELVGDALREAGQDLDDFEGWRFTLRYPPIPTQASLRVPLPLEPGVIPTVAP